MSEGTYYIPNQSKLPFCMAASLGLFAFGAGTFMINDNNSWLILGLLSIFSVMYFWFSTVIQENLKGLPNAQVKRSFVQGMSWFIISEVWFFAAFFGALLYVRMWAVPWLGGFDIGESTNKILWDGFEADWPLMVNPDQIAPVDEVRFTGPQEHMGFPGWNKIFAWLPLWNTLALITSSFTCHFAHHALKENNRKGFNTWLGVTIILAVIFLILQYEEYHHAYSAMGLTLNSGIYGTTFFMLTGFHGFHVLMGTLILVTQFFRSIRNHFTATDHFGFEAASWYWHFVDVVWVTLFIFVYVLGS